METVVCTSPTNFILEGQRLELRVDDFLIISCIDCKKTLFSAKGIFDIGEGPIQARIVDLMYAVLEGSRKNIVNLAICGECSECRRHEEEHLKTIKELSWWRRAVKKVFG